MNVSEKVQDELQSQANYMLGVLYDGSEDWWHTIYAEGEAWDLNIWDSTEYGDGSTTGLLMSAYPLTTDGVTDTAKYVKLVLDPLQLRIAMRRIKSRGGK